MDIDYRVNDPDDATVKVRALAFIDGVRSFANVVRMTAFVEGTDAHIGDVVPANTDLSLTWDIPVDWDIDLAEVTVEIMAKDDRGLLPFDWITIPATESPEHPEVTISLNSPTDADVLDALFWMYADGDPWLTIVDGVLVGTAESGVYSGLNLVSESAVQLYAAPLVLKRMNLAVADEIAYAIAARSGITDPSRWYAENRAYSGITPVVGWGDSPLPPAGFNGCRRYYSGVASRSGAKE
jgi:hypothetical protein